MTASPTPRNVPVRSGGDHTVQLARWATGLAAGVVAVLVVAYTLVGITWIVDGADQIEDTWIGFFGAVALIGGLATSLIAFGLAVVVRNRNVRSRMLVLPLTVFPALLAVLVLLEAFVLE
jgi:hypothetical protein